MTQPAPIHVASTVMLIRESGRLEILMVKRNQKIDFFSGAMVFPGGKVEPDDVNPAWADFATGWQTVPEDERGPRIAALRETFEETGVLAAADLGGLGPDHLATARALMDAGKLTFLEFVRSRSVTVDLTRLTFFARWLTPPVVPKRFDTFFYLIEMPAGQDARHDGREAVENEWVTPGDALRLYEKGERTILFPTRMNLRLLAQAPRLSDAIRSAHDRAPRQVVPSIETREGRRYLRLHADDGYGEVEEPLAIG